MTGDTEIAEISL